MLFATFFRASANLLEYAFGTLSDANLHEYRGKRKGCTPGNLQPFPSRQPLHLRWCLGISCTPGSACATAEIVTFQYTYLLLQCIHTLGKGCGLGARLRLELGWTKELHGRLQAKLRNASAGLQEGPPQVNYYSCTSNLLVNY